MNKILGAVIFFSLFSVGISQSTEQKEVRGNADPFVLSRGKSFSASVPTSNGTRGSGQSEKTLNGILRDYSDALRIVQNFYVDGDKTDVEELNGSAISSMLQTLDPHSSYFSTKEFNELLNDQHSEYFGIGATIANFRVADKFDTYVTSTFPDSPAYRAGLMFGDKIIGVNGESVTGKNSLYVRNRVRGKRGTIVRLSVQKNLTGRIETVVLRRNRVAQPSIPDAYMLSPGVGYIDLTIGFNYTTNEELTAALKELHRQGMTSLVLDLRDNPGGILEQAIRVAEKFLERGRTIASQQGRFVIDNRVWRSQNQRPEKFPLVVLVNGESASASEIVAGALQDYDRAFIIGEKTFGKGLVQSVIDLPFGSGLTLTTAKYYTPTGRLIQRDYSDGNLYDYYQHNGATAGVKSTVAKRTLAGRPVYSGDGIAPDLEIKTPQLTAVQTRLIDPIFMFSRELCAGRLSGSSSFRVDRQQDISKRINESDYAVDDGVLEQFGIYLKQMTARSGLENVSIDGESAFIRNRIRYNLISAAYGNTVAKQVIIENDKLISSAVASIPKARQLALDSISRPGRRSFE